MKVTRKEVVAYGTHSHSKTKLFLQGLVKKGEKNINLNHHDNVEMVDIIRKEGQVISKVSDKVQIMDNTNYETVDADVDKELLEYTKEPEVGGISLVSLEAGIKKCDANIIIFEDAIKKERATQEDYRQMIKDAERMEDKRNEGENVVSSINGVDIEAE